jgi:hypothetical protein
MSTDFKFKPGDTLQSLYPSPFLAQSYQKVEVDRCVMEDKTFSKYWVHHYMKLEVPCCAGDYILRLSDDSYVCLEVSQKKAFEQAYELISHKFEVGKKITIKESARDWIKENQFNDDMFNEIGKEGEITALNSFSVQINNNYLWDYDHIELVSIHNNNVNNNVQAQCPRCNSHLAEVKSDYTGTVIQKCLTCGWC